MRTHQAATKFAVFACVVTALGTNAYAQKKPETKKAAASAKAAPAKVEKAAPAAATPAPTKVDTGGVAKDKDPVTFEAKDVWNVDIFDREDHKVLVIQDRKYNKAGRLELGLDLGMMNTSPFYKSYAMGGHMTYHMSEYFGIEAFAQTSKSKLTADGKQIENFLETFEFPSKKEFKKPKFFGGVGLIWSPIYGKFAFFRSNIIHFDFYGQAGVSMLGTETNVAEGKDQKHIGSLLGLGMRVFFNDTWIWRFDAKNNIYRADFAAVSNNVNSTPATSLTLSNFHFSTSISMLFNLGGY